MILHNLIHSKFWDWFFLLFFNFNFFHFKKKFNFNFYKKFFFKKIVLSCNYRFSNKNKFLRNPYYIFVAIFFFQFFKKLPKIMYFKKNNFYKKLFLYLKIYTVFSTQKSIFFFFDLICFLISFMYKHFDNFFIYFKLTPQSINFFFKDFLLFPGAYLIKFSSKSLKFRFRKKFLLKISINFEAEYYTFLYNYFQNTKIKSFFFLKKIEA